MVLNDDAVHSDQTGRGKLESASINFLAGSRKTVPLACRSEDWIKILNAKQSQTSVGGKSDSPNIFFKN